MVKEEDVTVTIEVERLRDLLRTTKRTIGPVDHDDDLEDVGVIELKESTGAIQGSGESKKLLNGGLYKTAGLAGKGGSLENAALKALKASVLSAEWEVTDEIMARLIEQIDRLKEGYREEKIPQLFIRLLGVLAKYIKTAGTKVHPNAVEILSSAYSGFETMIQSKNMTEGEKEKIFLVEVERFNELKKEIGLKRIDAERKTMPQQATVTRSKIVEHGERRGLEKQDVSAEAFTERPIRSGKNEEQHRDAFTAALEEIKQVIKAEFRSLREELGLREESQ